MMATEGSGRTHCRSRVIRASPEGVYQAFVSPEAILAWRAPTGMRMSIEAFDPREGGAFRLRLDYEGDDHVPGKSSESADIVHGRFGALEPNRRIVELVDFESDDPAFAGTMTVTTTLTPVAEGTEVMIRCDDVPLGIGQGDHEAGMDSSLENLARYVE